MKNEWVAAALVTVALVTPGVASAGQVFLL
jgi:hypothetical protein